MISHRLKYLENVNNMPDKKSLLGRLSLVEKREAKGCDYNG